MKIVADESIEKPVVARLRAEGHQVTYIAEIAPGSTDPEVLELANREEALLVTVDKDFGDLVFHQNYQALGVILVRLPDDLISLEKANIIADVIRAHREELFHSFTVIASNKMRMTRILPRQNYPERE
jgi:predicted nuclease of predicted toxin-antitoxin system